MSEYPCQCELCCAYVPYADVALFRVRQGKLIRADDSWKRASGTRHVCKACIAVMSSPELDAELSRQVKSAHQEAK